jgi:hypothetical protein
MDEYAINATQKTASGAAESTNNANTHSLQSSASSSNSTIHQHLNTTYALPQQGTSRLIPLSYENADSHASASTRLINTSTGASVNLPATLDTHSSLPPYSTLPNNNFNSYYNYYANTSSGPVCPINGFVNYQHQQEQQHQQQQNIYQNSAYQYGQSKTVNDLSLEFYSATQHHLEANKQLNMQTTQSNNHSNYYTRCNNQSAIRVEQQQSLSTLSSIGSLNTSSSSCVYSKNVHNSN